MIYANHIKRPAVVRNGETALAGNSAHALAIILTGCSNGGSGSSTTNAPAPPAGLVERDESPIYAVGVPVVPETVSNSGGAISQCAVSPPLPPGLSLDPQNCTISGTPTGVSHASVYTVTGSNAAGSTTTRIEIEVKDAPIAPDGLDYLDRSVIYLTNAPITPNMPISTGGEITQYSVSPALTRGREVRLRFSRPIIL
ncbi:Ig domain-containing protein [Cupriavidus lacunae]|uniref:Ig domain-containing protein n=1 Tax=Cupriavidus lacunae TaxID=2666307 RepID=UPI001FC9138A|nr:Ig domain-containing protein [Cupriavidus lacunae]